MKITPHRPPEFTLSGAEGSGALSHRERVGSLLNLSRLPRDRGDRKVVGEGARREKAASLFAFPLANGPERSEGAQGKLREPGEG